MDLSAIPVQGYEKVIQCHDTHSGLSTIISIHTTNARASLGWHAHVAL
jgi:hypothetical protein